MIRTLSSAGSLRLNVYSDKGARNCMTTHGASFVCIFVVGNGLIPQSIAEISKKAKGVSVKRLKYVKR